MILGTVQCDVCNAMCQYWIIARHVFKPIRVWHQYFWFQISMYCIHELANICIVKHFLLNNKNCNKVALRTVPSVEQPVWHSRPGSLCRQNENIIMIVMKIEETFVLLHCQHCSQWRLQENQTWPYLLLLYAKASHHIAVGIASLSTLLTSLSDIKIINQIIVVQG